MRSAAGREGRGLATANRANRNSERHQISHRVRQGTRFCQISNGNRIVSAMSLQFTQSLPDLLVDLFARADGLALKGEFRHNGFTAKTRTLAA